MPNLCCAQLSKGSQIYFNDGCVSSYTDCLCNHYTFGNYVQILLREVI